MILNCMKKQDGLSLVELMIALSLLGIVLALGFMYFNFGVQAFDRGERQTIAQQASRITSDFVTAELRFAKEIEINPTDGISESGDGYRYIYLDDKSILFRDENGNDRILADGLADSIPYHISFTSNVPYDVVYFYITADMDENKDIGEYISIDEEQDIWNFDEQGLEDDAAEGLYFLQTKVQALNLELYKAYGLDDELIKLNGKGGTVIKYQVPTQ